MINNTSQSYINLWATTLHILFTNNLPATFTIYNLCWYIRVV